MFGRNVDVFAVLFIAIVMVGFSKAASLRPPDVMSPIQMQNAMGVDSCPLRDEFLSRIEYILNQ
jgi:hypothetical protein